MAMSHATVKIKSLAHACMKRDYIYGKYSKDYWLIIETSENTTLNELDQFIRDIWVRMLYEYDFGSTTELIMNIHSVRDGAKGKNEIVIL